MKPSGMSNSLLATLLLIATVAAVADDVSQRLAEVKHNLAATQKLLQTIKSLDFDLLVDRSNVGVETGALQMLPSVLAYLTDNQETSSDVEEMKNQYTQVDHELLAGVAQFEEIKNKINWTSVRSTIFTDEITIRAAKINLKQIVVSPFHIRNLSIHHFIVKFESDFKFAALNVFEGIVNGGKVDENILLAGRHFTKENRREFQVLSMGLLKLLYQAIQVEMAYAKLKTPDSTQKTFDLWMKRLEVVKERLRDEDEKVKAMFQKQVNIDSVTWLSQNTRLKNNEFVKKFYDFVTNKYYWRHWFVLAYEMVTGWENQASRFCWGAFSQLKYNRNLIFSSQDILDSRFNSVTAEKLLHSIRVNEPSALKVEQAIEKVTGIGCDTYTFRGAVCWGCDVWWVPTKQIVYRKICTIENTNCFNAFLFG